MSKRFLRFTIPYCTCYVLLFILMLVLKRPLDYRGYIYSFFFASFGKGAYYFPIMIEFLVVFPILYRLIDRFAEKGLVLVAGANLLFEIASPLIPDSVYRILIFRYITMIASGIYMRLCLSDETRKKQIKKSAQIWMVLLGAAYIGLPKIQYTYRIFTTSWNGTSMVTALFVSPIIYFLLKKFGQAAAARWWEKLIQRVGQSSYHIMYTQLIWYCVIDFQKFRSFMPSAAVGSVTAIWVAASVVVSVLTGMVFFYADRVFFSILFRKKIFFGRNKAYVENRE